MNNHVLHNSQLVKELTTNKRLQGLLVLVAMILCLSAIKWLVDVAQIKETELIRQAALNQRLLNASSREIEDGNIQNAEAAQHELSDKFPTAASLNVAEAQALRLVDQIGVDLMTRQRATLIGADTLIFGRNDVWQIRIELNGQLDPTNLISMLAHFDQSDVTKRIVSMQYRPKASNSITLVLDFLYLPEAS